MHLSPADQEKLLLSVAGMVARDRRERGVLLNHPESVALLSCWVIERAREGASVAGLMEEGRRVLGTDEVLPGVAAMVDEVQVEATFPDGRKLVTLHRPIDGPIDGPIDAPSVNDGSYAPGAVRVRPGAIVINAGLPVTTLVVVNTGDRPIQIGSHLHLPDANPSLELDRAAAHGLHLDIPSGTSVRFEPGVSRSVDAVPFTGRRRVPGLQRRHGWTSGRDGELDG